MREDASLQTMRALIAAFNAHDLRRVTELVDEQYVGESDFLPEPIQGREAYLAMLDGYYRSFPDCHYEIEQMVASGDDVFTRLRITGTQTGEFLGAPPSGRRFDIHLCHYDQIRDGRVVYARYYWDTATMMRQLGLTDQRAGTGRAGA